VTLRASINYAVCEKLCIPVEAQAELAFVSVASTEDGAISSALDTVPKPAKVGATGALSIRDVRREGNVVQVDVAVQDDKAPSGRDKDVQLFAEGPTPDWALPVPKLVKREPGVQRFAFELDGLPPGASADGATLKLTVAGPGGAYEVNAKLP